MTCTYHINAGNKIVRHTKVFVRGLVKYDPAVAYHFCLNKPQKISKPGAHFLAQPFRYLKEQRIVVSILISSQAIYYCNNT